MLDRLTIRHTMDLPSSAAPGASPATKVDALERECAALRAEIVQLRAHLARAEQAAQSRLVESPAHGGPAAVLQELQAAFETAGVGMVVMHYRTMRRCNRAMERMFGYPPGALDQQSVALLHGQDARWEQVGEDIRRTMRSGEVYRDECALQRRDGTHFWVRRAGCALAANDPMQGTVWVYQDITAERQAAQDMQQARELAEQAARMQSQFLANMRHEIRTPMNNILGLSQLALGSGLPASQHEQLRRIRSSAQQLYRMLMDILDLSAIESGQVALQVQAFSPSALVQEIAMQALEAAAAKGLALRTETLDGMPRALGGDVAQLGRLLSIYVHNAIKFTAQGEVRIVASAADADGSARMLRLEVRDTGIGLDPEASARLFKPFAQADNSATRRHGGPGLGLSLCRALARLMGATVGVDSRPGAGSTFWLTLRLPLADTTALSTTAPQAPQAQTQAQLGPAADADAVGPAHLERLDALLADSDPDALDWLAHHTSGLAPLLGPDFPAFADRVRSFDFDAARDQLQKLRGGPGNPQSTAPR